MLLGLAGHLSVLLAGNVDVDPEALFVQRSTETKEFVPQHGTIRERLQNLTQHSEFKEACSRCGLFGTHSIRQSGMTYCIRCGESEQHGEMRGRWRGDTSKAVKAYISLIQPWPDARIAAVLCGVMGPCQYLLRDSRLRTNAFLENVIPGLFDSFKRDGAAEVIVYVGC